MTKFFLIYFVPFMWVCQTHLIYILWNKLCDYICWVTGGPSTSRLEQSHLQKRRHTLTQNLRQWILLLIRCSTFTLLSNMGHITHTYTQHTPPQVWVHHFIVLPLQGEALTCLYHRYWFLHKRSVCLGRTLRRNGVNNHTCKRDTTLLPKTLRQWVYASSYL